MSKKNIIFIISTQGTGNNLMKEVFVSLGFKQINDNPLVFWPLYQKALTHPEEICFNRLIKDNKLFAQTKLNNREALKKLYESWGYHLRSSEIFSEEIAKNIFKEIISDKIKEKNLIILHHFEYIHPLREIKPGNVFDWSQSESDNVFDYITQSLNDSSFDAKYLCILRHPLSIYLSVKERLKNQWSHEERINHIVGYIRRIEEIEANKNLNNFLLRYEDFCENPEYFLKELLNWIFPDREKTEYQKALKIIQRPSKKKPVTKIKEDVSQLKKIAKKYGYLWVDDNHFISLMKMQIKRYFYEFRIIIQVLFGNVDSLSVINRHKFSFPGKLFIRLIQCIPFLHSKWLSLQKKQEQLRINGKTIQPKNFSL